MSDNNIAKITISQASSGIWLVGRLGKSRGFSTYEEANNYALALKEKLSKDGIEAKIELIPSSYQTPAPKIKSSFRP